jgi:MerR family transcriptional regulator/heat shock protein HspR
MSGPARRRAAPGVTRSTRAPGSGGRPGAGTPEPDVPVFVISVAAELTGLHPQTLRTYDRLGLVSPGRTSGGGRRYSWRDIELLREVAQLTSSGIGLEGVRRILELEHQVSALQSRNAELRQRVRDLEGVRRILELEHQVHALRARVGELEHDLSAAEYALRSTLQRSTPRNLPAVRAEAAGQSVTVWRRGRL